jgi:hypothetical protein
MCRQFCDSESLGHCRLLALLGHAEMDSECLVLRQKRTSQSDGAISVFDPGTDIKQNRKFDAEAALTRYDAAH